MTLGGIGLQTGQYAYVRVRPALAGEGRYFVRVPPGTNAARFVVDEPEPRTLEDLDIQPPEDDPYEDERSEVFFKWLTAREAGYEGNLDGMSGLVGSGDCIWAAHPSRSSDPELHRRWRISHLLAPLLPGFHALRRFLRGAWQGL